MLLDYSGDWKQLRDVLRGRVVVDDAHDLGRCCDALQERVQVVSVKNRFRGAACGSGYRDLNIVAKDDDAFLFEVQIHLKDVLVSRGAAAPGVRACAGTRCNRRAGQREGG